MKAIEDFLNSNQVVILSQSTRDNYRYALATFKDFHEAMSDASDASEISESASNEMMELFCNYLQNQKKSPATIRQYLTILKMFFRFHGVTVSYSYRVPSADKKVQQAKEIARWFTEEEVTRCLDYDFPDQEEFLRVRNKLLVRLVAETGARIREIANIKRKDFRPSEHTVFLKHSKTKPRPAFYSKQTAALVQKIPMNERDLFGKPINTLFPSTEMCKLIITNMLKALGLKSDKDGRGPHTFRHFVATRSYYDGEMDLTDLAIMLGDKPDTIRNKYLHPTAKMLQRRANKAWGWDTI